MNSRSIEAASAAINPLLKANRLRRVLPTRRILLGGVTVVASLVAYMSYQVTRELFLENLQTNVLHEVQAGGDQLDHWLIARKTEVQTLANTPTLRSMDWLQVEPFLKPELSRLSDFYFFSMIRPEGSYYSTVVGEAKGKNLRDRKHVQRSLAGHTYVSDPVLSRTLGGQTIVAVTTPIYEDATSLEQLPVGVLAGLIDIDHLVEVVENLSYGEGSYAFALNSEGLAISHPDTTLMSTINDEDPERLTHDSQGELAAIARKMVNRDRDIQLIQYQGKSVYVAFLPLVEAEWSIALVIPRQNIDSQLWLLDLLAVLVGSIALATLGLLLRVQQIEQRNLRESKALADSANQAKSQFLSNMSHELRTPLNAILGFGQLMQDDRSIAEGHRNSLKVIHRSGEHLLLLINDVLAMSKIEAGHVSLNTNVFSLCNFLDDLRDMLRLKAEEKGLDLVFERSPGLPTQIQADEGKLRQILLNLLNNAIKFTEQGSVKLLVEPVNEQSEHQAKDSLLLRFSVIDSGAGIAQEELKELFVAFAQTETGRRSQMGTGLGLPISRTFAQMMDGDIQVCSEVGQGSEFHCEIRVQRLDGFQVECQKFNHVLGLAPGQPRYRMLVAEDNLYSRQLLVQLLESKGFEVEAVATGEKALARWKTWQPQMLWMDLRMPGMGGLETAAAIKIEATSSDEYIAPIMVAVTANAFDSDRTRAFEAGYDDFVAKPYAHCMIFEKIATHLDVEFSYEEGQSLDADSSHCEPFTISAADLEIMPLAWQDALRQASLHLNGELIEHLVEEIPAHHAELKAALDNVVRDFRYDILLDLLGEECSEAA